MTRLEIIKVSKKTKIDTRPESKRKLIKNERHVGCTCVSLHYKGSNLIGYRVPGGFWVDFFHKKPLIQP